MNTNTKGDIGLVKVISDLTVKGYIVYVPISEHSVVDLIALKNNKVFRLQVKYSINKRVICNTVRLSQKNGIISNKYKENDFDYYAIYKPLEDIVLYAPFCLGGKDIRTVLPKGQYEFYWYEDFLEINDNIPNKRKTSDFGEKIFNEQKSKKKKNIQPNMKRPSYEILLELAFTTKKIDIAKRFGVSSSVVSKWFRIMNIETPPRGYWLKNKHGDNAK